MWHTNKYKKTTILSGENCQKHCNLISIPVCGTNHVTYTNRCMLENAACRDQRIKIAHKGTCKKAKVENRDLSENEPVNESKLFKFTHIRYFDNFFCMKKKKSPSKIQFLILNAPLIKICMLYGPMTS